jgi:hypothetical protein
MKLPFEQQRPAAGGLLRGLIRADDAMFKVPVPGWSIAGSRRYPAPTPRLCRRQCTFLSFKVHGRFP